MRIFVFLCLVVTGVHGASAQEMPAWNSEATARLDSLLETMNAQKQFNGAVLLAEGDRIVYEKNLGVVNISKNDFEGGLYVRENQ